MSILENITPYGICGAIGFILGIVYLIIVCKKKKLFFDDYIYIYVWAVAGAMIGAKILYILLSLPEIMESLRKSQNIYEWIMTLLSGGFIFYGGLLGSIAFVCLASTYFKIKKGEVFKIITPAMPLAHATVRIGCAVVGCCYGVQISHGFGIVYTKSEFAPLGVKLFPVQIVETIGNVLIFILLISLVKRNKDGYIILKTYLVLYAVFRFMLEFLRGDQERAKWGNMSTSQWISLIILGVVIGISLKREKIKFQKKY